MVTIIFESHGTTFDNENKISSGLHDSDLSPSGEKQAKELGDRRKKDKFDAIFCSDLIRSRRTAEIAFAGSKIPIFNDARLQECDYGDFNGYPTDEVEPLKRDHIYRPFPKGESYEETSDRMKKFLDDLLISFDGKKVLIIGHRATQYGLDRWADEVDLKEAVTRPWKWQPGWEYHYPKK
ncbi:histidine phosphatase family protein [Patescibacteria group bacterium]